MMEKSKITFLQGFQEEAMDIINRYHETGDLSDFLLIEGESAHGWVYQLTGYPYVIKIYKPEAFNNQDHYILRQLLECPYAPQMYAYADNKFVVMEYVKGLSIKEYLDEFQYCRNVFTTN
jgi:predicted Ser/Thr protein kinase